MTVPDKSPVPEPDNPPTARRASRLATENRTVLFACVGNAGRSLMAEAIFNSRAPAGWRGVSAGVSPARAPNPLTGEALAEIEVPLPPHGPQLLTEEMARRASVRVSIGAFDHPACPPWFGPKLARRWEIPDTHYAGAEKFRGIRDDLGAKVDSLIRELTEKGSSRG